MAQIKLLKATQLVEKTLPCTLKKFWVWFGVCFAFLACTLVGAGIGLIVYAFGLEISILAWVFSSAGFLICGYFLMKLRGSIFVPLRAGHVKVLLEQMKKGAELDRKQQIQLSENTATYHFGSVVKLAALERSIRGVLTAIYSNRLQIKRFSFGNPYCERVLKLLVGIMTASIAEVILAYAIRATKEKPVVSCKKALALYYQEVDAFTKPLWVMNLFTGLGWMFFIFMMLFPINWLTGMLPFSFGIWNVIFAMVFAWNFKAVILETISVAAFIPVFFETVDGKELDPETPSALAELSTDFANMK